MAKWCSICSHYCPDSPRHVSCEPHTQEAVDWTKKLDEYRPGIRESNDDTNSTL